MKTQRIGRNDPCPCGNGKKSKTTASAGRTARAPATVRRACPKSCSGYSKVSTSTRWKAKLIELLVCVTRTRLGIPAESLLEPPQAHA